jgi:hypothetical protein
LKNKSINFCRWLSIDFHSHYIDFNKKLIKSFPFLFLQSHAFSSSFSFKIRNIIWFGFISIVWFI